MSEEAKKTAPAQEAEQPETAPEEKAQQAAPEQEPAAEAADPKDDKKKDGGWFNKKARELEAVKAKLDAAEANAAQAKDQLLRMAAEYENYKKGVTMTLDKAAKALDALHVEEIEALGKPFDPNFMNAVQQIPAPDGQESGTVITVYQKGYKLGDKIVRHATVVVAE